MLQQDLFSYADDTAILAVGNSTSEVQAQLQCDLDEIYEWFAQNKLIVNCSKTTSIPPTSDRSKYKSDKLDLTQE